MGQATRRLRLDAMALTLPLYPEAFCLQGSRDLTGLDLACLVFPLFVGLTGVATRRAMSMGDDYDYDLIIVGCGVGGHGAALHARSCGMYVYVQKSGIGSTA